MDNYYFAYTHTNILKIPIVAVSIISGVSMPIIDEKRLGKPPLPSGGLPHLTSLYLSTPMGYGVGGEGVVCTAMVGWLYTGRYLAVSGVSMVCTE